MPPVLPDDPLLETPPLLLPLDEPLPPPEEPPPDVLPLLEGLDVSGLEGAPLPPEHATASAAQATVASETSLRSREDMPSGE